MAESPRGSARSALFYVSYIYVQYASSTFIWSRDLPMHRFRSPTLRD